MIDTYNVPLRGGRYARVSVPEGMSADDWRALRLWAESIDGLWSLRGSMDVAPPSGAPESSSDDAHNVDQAGAPTGELLRAENRVPPDVPLQRS